jgi:biopolymer transport protein ExbD
MSRSVIKSGDFRINLRSYYFVNIDIDGGRLQNAQDCPAWRDHLLIRSSLYRNGQLIEHLESNYFYLGQFQGEAGVYRLEVEHLADSGCLDIANPRLRVASLADFSDLRWAVFWLSVPPFAIGLALLFQPLAAKLGIKLPPHVIVTNAKVTTCVSRRRQRLPLRPLFSQLPSFGTMGALTIVAVLLPCWIIFGSQQPHLKGLKFYVLPPAMTQNRTMRWAEGEIGIDIYVRYPDQWYLNSKPIAPVDLPAALRNELSRRADWVVYVEGDPDLNVEQIARAMDIVIGLHAKPILLTPNTRKELLKTQGHSIQDTAPRDNTLLLLK